MRKAILVMLLAVSSNAAAAWVALGTTTDKTTDYYIDRGTLVKMWTLEDYKTAQEGPGSSRSYLSPVKYLSSKSQYEYDCKEKRSRMLSLTWYSKNLGKGEVVNFQSDSDSKWGMFVVPGSVGESLWKVACGKR